MSTYINMIKCREAPFLTIVRGQIDNERLWNCGFSNEILVRFSLVKTVHKVFAIKFWMSRGFHLNEENWVTAVEPAHNCLCCANLDVNAIIMSKNMRNL